MKRYFLIIMILCVLAIACSAMIACNSTEDPLPAEYTGTYSNEQYGSIEVTAEEISSKMIQLPECTMDGKKLEVVMLEWDGVPFEYNKEKKFSFTANAKDAISGKSGKVDFNGYLEENLFTYDAWLYYAEGKAAWLAKDK